MTRVRWALVVVLLASGPLWGVLLLETDNPLWEAGQGLVMTLALWLFFALVLWLVAWIARRRRPLWRWAVSSPVLLAMLILQGTGLYTSSRPRTLDADEREFIAYVNDSIPCYERAQGIYAVEEAIGEAAAADDLAAAERSFSEHRRILTDLADCLGELADTGDEELNRAATGIADALRVRVVADDFYLHGLGQGDLEVIDRGDEHDRRARATVDRAFDRLNAIGRAHGPEVDDHIDFERLRALGPRLGDPA